MTEDQLNKIKKGLRVGDFLYRSIKIYPQKTSKKISVYELLLSEGKNREIRNVMNYFGLKVLKLKRIQYGPFLLESLDEGDVKEIEEEKVKNFLKQLKFSYENNFW